MFFLETSSSSSFTVRQSCAIESAAIQTRRNIIVVINTPFLSLCQESMKGYIWIFSLFYLIHFFWNLEFFFRETFFLSSSILPSLQGFVWNFLLAPLVFIMLGWLHSQQCMKMGEWVHPAAKLSTTVTLSDWLCCTGPMPTFFNKKLPLY